jgi:hypothetical protein
VRDIAGNLPVDVVMQFLKLWCAMRALPPRASKDTCIWKWHANGRFSSGSAYRTFFHGRTVLPVAALV